MPYPLPVRVNMWRIGMALLIAEIVALSFMSLRVVAFGVGMSAVIPRSRILSRSALWNEAAANPAVLLLVLLATGLGGDAPISAAVLLASMAVAAASVLVLTKRRKADHQ